MQIKDHVFIVTGASVRAVYQHYGRIDGLVNNAGCSYAASIEEIEPEIFDEIFHLNVLGPSRCRR